MSCPECGVVGAHAPGCSRAEPRPRIPTTQPMERLKMAASWVREAARVLRSLGKEARAKRLDHEADELDADAESGT
jgi:hypothetical protein